MSRLDEDGHQLIELRTPLPCASLDCGESAFVAHALPVITSDADHITQWLVQPVCETCTRKLLEIYKTSGTDPEP